MINLEWEVISKTEMNITKRMKVFGGWVVRYNGSAEYSMVFVPDANREWLKNE